jgi:hypothetical protein
VKRVPCGCLSSHASNPSDADIFFLNLAVKTNIMANRPADWDDAAWSKIKPLSDHHHSGPSGYAEPQLIANLMLFLASDLSKEISGAAIPIDHAFCTL